MLCSLKSSMVGTKKHDPYTETQSHKRIDAHTEKHDTLRLADQEKIIFGRPLFFMLSTMHDGRELHNKGKSCQ